MERTAKEKKAIRPTLQKLGKYFGRFRVHLVLILGFTLGGTAFGILGPRILGRATTLLFQGMVKVFKGEGGMEFQKVGVILGLLLILYLLSAGMSLFQGYLMTGIAQKITYQMRKEIAEKLNRLPAGYFDRISYGDILSRMTNDVDTLSQNLNQSAAQVLSSVVTVLGILIMMFRINVWMTVVSLLALFLSMGGVSFLVSLSQKYFRMQQQQLGELNGEIEEVYSGQNIVKAFHQEENTLQEFAKKNQLLFQSAWKSQFLSGLMMPMMQFVNNLGYVAVVILGGYLSFRKMLEVGDIQAFIQYVRQFTMPIQELAQAANLFQAMIASAERIFEFLEEKEEEEEEEHLELEGRGEVCFQNISFGYEEGREVLHDFSARIQPGQTVAIVGPTGAGKTTLMKLLMRFYDPKKGRILIDGKDIRRVSRKSLRSIFGVVLQDVWLFEGSIEANIGYGNLQAGKEAILEAAHQARADKFIRTLPMGYQMELREEASNISAGQKQLITIARAILSNPKILILDEATSSVDTKTERDIQKAMQNLMKGRTCFVIAHRLSTIRDADLILVMKDGDIIEQGNHQNLLEKKGFYADLYQAQFEGGEP